jgi:hypothetical protein
LTNISENVLLITAIIYMSLSKLKIASLRNPKTLLSILLQLSILIVSVSYSFMYPPQANASLTLSYVRFDRQSAAAALSGTVCMKSTQTAPAVAKVVVQFPSTFTMTGTAGQWTDDVTAANLPATTTGDAFTATPWPVTGTSIAVSNGGASNSATFIVGDLANSTLTYCFHFTGYTGSQVGATGAGTGSVTAYTKDASGGAVVESFPYATFITSGANSEQIGVTATVSASFTFGLSGGASGQSLPLGVLNSASVVTSPYLVQAQISTNAHNGFLSWVKGSQATHGLYSTTANDTVLSVTGASAVDLTSNTGWGLYAQTGTNAPTIATTFGGGANTVGQCDNNAFYQIASKTGYQSNTTFNIGAKAKPLATTAAANDYTETVTVVASGSF